MGVQFAGNILIQTNGGPLPISQGGTGEITAPAAINALLPSQTSNAGKVLSTNGTSASWTSTAGVAGSDTYIQYNDSGVFGGSNKFVINKTTGELTSTSTFSGTGLYISDAAATSRALTYQTAGSDRWISQTNNVAESGSNVGSNFEFIAVADNGLTQNQVFTVARSTRIVDFKQAPTINGVTIGTGNITIGSTSIALGGTSTTLAGLSSVTSTSFVGALTGNASTVTNGVYTTDTGTVTNTMLAGSIANAKLSNSSLTVGSTNIALGATSTTLAGLTSVTSTTFVGALTGNASTATTSTNIASGAAGNIVYQSGSGATALLTTGTSSQVLISGTTPSWTNTPTLTGTNFTGIPNAALTNNSVTVGSTNIALGSSATTLAGLSSVTSTSFTGALTGAASANVLKAGDTMTGLLILSADPSNDLGAATKQYVDAVASGLNIHGACITSTTAGANLSTATYNNGSGGVGATLTSTTNLSLNTSGVGGYSGLVVGSRILVKNQGTTTENGIYEVTVVGNAGTPWVLTRTADFDGSPTSEIKAGDTTYIQNGTLAGSQWVLTTIGSGSPGGYIVLGTDSVVFTQISGAGAYTAGTGINIGSNVISNTGVLSNVAGANISVSSATGNVTIAVTGTVPSATTSTNIAGGLAGNIPYQSGAGATSLLTTGTTSQVLVSGATPSWTNTPTLTGTNFTGIPNGGLTNSSLTLGSTNIALGATATTLAGLSSVTSTSFVGALTGNASTATTAGTVTTAAQPTITSVGTLSALAVTGTHTQTGALNLAGASSPLQVGGSAGTSGQVLTSAGAGVTPTWSAPAAGAAGTLTGTTLAANVVSSSLTSVGTITSGVWNGTAIANANLANSSLTVGSTNIALGATATTLAGLSSVTSTNFVGAHDGTVGATTPAAGTFTSLTSTGSATLGDAEASDTHTIKGATTLLVNSASAALTVTQTGAGNAFVVEDSASTDSTPFVIDASGRLLKGYTLPITSAFGTNPSVQVHNGASNDGASWSRWGADANGFSHFFQKSGGAAVGTRGIVASGYSLGSFYWTGDDGTNWIRGAQISAEVDGTPGTNDMPGRLIFSTTADGASSPTERFRFASAGQFGIAGANYGTSGQVMISGGASAAPSWSSTPTLTGTNFTGIPNAGLTNSSLTVGSTNIALGATSTTLAGLTSVTSTTFVGALTGNASTATTAGTVTTAAQPSITSVGTLSALAVTGTQTQTGALNLAGASSPLQVGGSAGTSGQVLTSAGAGVTPTWSAPAAGAAGTLTGTTLAANVVSSSLTSVGTLSALNVNATATVTGVTVDGLGNIDTATLTTSATTPNQVVDTLAVATYRSVKYIISVTSSTSYHYTEVNIIHDGTTAFINETNTMFTGASLATFDAAISVGNLTLTVTPTNAVTTIKAMRLAIAV